MSENSSTNLQFIACPACNGSGENKDGSNCPNCDGMGLGVFHGNRFYYVGEKINKASIIANRIKKTLGLVLNLAAFLFAIAGLAALSWWVWLVSSQASQLGALAFWREKSIFILMFWLSVIADMFIYYRLSQEQAKSRKIIRPGFSARQTALPDNWQELKQVKGKFKINALTGYSREALKAVAGAFLLADKARQGEVKITHLFFSLLKDREVGAIFSRLNQASYKMMDKIKNQLASYPRAKTATIISAPVKEILIEAYLDGLAMKQTKVEPFNFILPCLKRDQVLSEILYDLEIDAAKINNVIQWFLISRRLYENYKTYKAMAKFKPGGNMDRAYLAVATPLLNNFARDLTLAAKFGRLDISVGRDKETEDIFQKLESGQNGIILVGPPGVGKKAIIGHIAQLMVSEEVPALLKDKRLIELDIARLLAGASAEQAEGRLLVIIDEIARAGNIILYIDNIENITGISAGGEQSLDLSEVLAGALERKQLVSLASANQDNYLKFIEHKPLGNFLAKVEINEPEFNLAVQMAESKIGWLEAKYKTYFTYNAIAKTVELAGKYIHDKYLPAKALTILESAAVKVAKSQSRNKVVEAEDVASVVSDLTHIPLTKISDQESAGLLNLEEKIHERMIDQTEAVQLVASSLRRARAELRENKRPIASFLFLGPTGVGKTELAKTIAEVYFGQENYMIRLDMSEYQRPDSISKMIGGPGGETGYLTQAVRQSPFALILLDEFEKAHPEILNLFLQVMDDGRLTDGQGQTIDFTNAIIIATSNAGAVFIQDQLLVGAPMEEIKRQLINYHLNKIMRPELINRFDAVVVFKPLSLADVASIAKIMLNKVGGLLSVKGINFTYEAGGAKKLAEEGYDPKFGARPLRRLIQEKIEDEIANKILAKEINRRDTVVVKANLEIVVKKARRL